MLRYFCLLLVFFTATTGYAQSKRKKSKSEAVKTTQSTSLAPYYPKEDEVREPKKKKRSSGKVTYSARDKFYDRMEELEKANRKNEKMMAKPQYSDPSYFGHKRPPKKRPPGKMKFCKECKIRH